MKTRIEKLLVKFPFATKEKVFSMYIEEQKSLPIIYKETGIDYKAFQFFLNHYGIPKRSISESRLTKEGSKRIKESFFSKYGVENPSQIDEVKEKKRKTFLKNYGVDNIWKSKKYYEWLNDYMLINYGVKRISTNPWGWVDCEESVKKARIEKFHRGRDKWWETLTDEERSVIMGKLCSSNTFSSKIESRIENSLNRLHISHKRWVNLGNRNFDFKINESNILIEVNGDFWHANPKIYKSDEFVNFPNGKIKAENIWKRDSDKAKVAEERGFCLIVIWEHDLKSMSEFDVDNILLKSITR
jgi:G:T-mismatch repair DNA endonuclease (very short patch repair protein)